jgi:glucose/arabinose dehydrogenase
MKLIILLGVLIVLVGASLFFYNQAFAPTESSIPVIEKVETETEQIFEVATNLSIPWDVAWLSAGEFLVTERTGSLLRLSSGQTPRRLTVPNVSPVGEGGLLGITLHPNFAENRFLYLYKTVLVDDERLNEVVRFTYNDNHTLSEPTPILTGLPGARYHDGGALSFGPDGYLYITTGDAGTPALAQDVMSLAGKILRVTEAGEIPPDNPFNSAVYSYGHRNPQGLAWDSDGRLWSTEHGRSGIESGYDELNQIISGGNYGWPDSEGDTVLDGTIAPVVHSGANETWAPASLTSMGDTLYFAGLRGARLYLAEVDTGEVELTAFFPEEYGRLRAARIFEDTLYLSTSNTDGRGKELSGDDRLLAVPLKYFLVE